VASSILPGKRRSQTPVVSLSGSKAMSEVAHANLFDINAFAREIRVRIAERGINQARCAEEVGISKATISRICTGKKAPDVENYLRLVQWLASRPLPSEEERR